MRFNSVLASKYRKNGYLFVAIDHTGFYYDIFIQHPNGKATLVDTFSNKGVAIKEAKQLAMTEKLGFNVDTDIII